MTTIVTRITNPTGGTAKGTPLTSVEIDANFINLNDNKLEITDLVSTNTAYKGVRRDSTGSINVQSVTLDGALGVGTSASSTAGEIRATNQITSFYSDERLKENIELIPNALDKVMQLRGVTYNSNKLAESFGFINKEKQVGVISSDVESVLPEAVKPAPFDIMLFEQTELSKSGENYKTVQYEKLVPLLIEAIKELNIQVKNLKGIE
jgi:hypothetical protein